MTSLYPGCFIVHFLFLGLNLVFQLRKNYEKFDPSVIVHISFLYYYGFHKTLCDFARKSHDDKLSPTFDFRHLACCLLLCGDFQTLPCIKCSPEYMYLPLTVRASILSLQ